ncbi:DLW-39 family protein [Brachybacterium sp. J144]|uniref:DLW-39 family protein n=1 Tax=Brachybacterium sp. J144 TaxID=3116487 RepID=UPI002E778ACA|nr:DLW-39 family protein [Brachybacterium sp. J144]MEE1650363.1 DLW-39 family protein [Brachybacterium sp. J144]
MKRFITAVAVLIGTTAAGLLAWRKIESDRIRNDLWSEAERISAEQDAHEAVTAPVASQN